MSQVMRLDARGQGFVDVSAVRLVTLSGEPLDLSPTKSLSMLASVRFNLAKPCH